MTTENQEGEKPQQPSEEIISVDPEETETIGFFEQNLKLAKGTALAKLANATTLSEFMMLTHAAKNLISDRLAWSREENEERSPEELLNDFTGESDQEHFAEEAESVRQLLSAIDPKKTTDKVQIVIQKVPDKFVGIDQYKALALFPPGKETSFYDIARVNPSPEAGDGDIVYIDSLLTGCNQQAAELLLEGQLQAVIEVDFRTLRQLDEDLDIDYALPRQNLGNRDPGKYLLYSLQGGFTGEGERYLISDFKAPSETGEISPEGNQ